MVKFGNYWAIPYAVTNAEELHPEKTFDIFEVTSLGLNDIKIVVVNKTEGEFLFETYITHDGLLFHTKDGEIKECIVRFSPHENQKEFPMGRLEEVVRINMALEERDNERKRNPEARP